MKNKNNGLKFMVIALSIFAITTTGCNATMHTVGSGGKGNCKSVGQYDASMVQWYLFWGLLPLNKADSKDLVGGAQNYTIRTTSTFVDCLISGAGNALLGLQRQTIRVSKGK
jgi:hypothetical protein